MVSPSPELRERMKADLERIRSTTSGPLSKILKMRGASYPGMNDGLLYPGDLYPLGTTARVVKRAASSRSPPRGEIRAIVILAQFSDQPMSESRQHFEELFFSSGVLPNGSVREYYQEVSNDLVDVIGEVIGPYDLPLTMKEYAHGESGCGLVQPNARTMARDAVIAAIPDVDFSKYDNDGDGYVDALIIVHAGTGAERTGDVDQIWSHKWVLPTAHNANGTNLYAYLTVPEDSKIGVCCHELGHLLFGFPDLYDVDYSSGGVGDWCLMSGGSWNGNEEIPAHPSAWCKLQQGWVTVVNQTTNGPVDIEAVETGHTIYRLWKNGGSSKEYFLVENRQRVLFDRALPGEGLLIWHVDDSIEDNSDENHYLVALEQADSLMHIEEGINQGDDGDPYPGSSNNTRFDKASRPGSLSYGRVDTSVFVTNIPGSNAVMRVNLGVRGEAKDLEQRVIDLEARCDRIEQYIGQVPNPGLGDVDITGSIMSRKRNR